MNGGRQGGATGGGVSAYFPCPAYQQAGDLCTRSVNPGARTGRGVPDVAGNADPNTGYIIQVDFSRPVPYGGTSAVAPLWAALIALINEKLDGKVGFLNPTLYQIGESSAFREITEGDNNTAWRVGGYSAHAGWNACSGWGSPNGQMLLEALLNAQSPAPDSRRAR